MRFAQVVAFAVVAAPTVLAELASRKIASLPSKYSTMMLVLTDKVLTSCPACAVTCITGSIPDGCDPADASCFCNSAYFRNTYVACIARDCTPDEANVAQSYVLDTFCSEYTA